LAQPAVSKHIKDLEDHFGGPLLARRPDGVRLTYAASNYLAALATSSAKRRSRRREYARRRVAKWAN